MTMTTNDDNSPLDLDAIEARANDAVRAPWFLIDGVSIPAIRGATDDGRLVRVCQFGWNNGDEAVRRDTANARFVAHAREDVPALVARVRELTAANERLRSAARGVIDGFLAMQDDLRAGADEAARVANAERLRDAFRALVEEASK